MKLSRTERWILSNQYRILELLDTENADRHRHAQNALNSGYEMMYDWLCEYVYDDDNVLPEEECKYVLNVMDMFDSMQRAYDELEDKSGIKATDVVFHGFDGNNETAHMAFARFFCEEREAFQHLRKGSDGFNSHFPTRDLNRRMLNALEESKNKHDLTKDDLLRIAQAKIHPSNRGSSS